jgi:Ca2+/Na+ antiporter
MFISSKVVQRKVNTHDNTRENASKVSNKCYLQSHHHENESEREKCVMICVFVLCSPLCSLVLITQNSSYLSLVCVSFFQLFCVFLFFVTPREGEETKRKKSSLWVPSLVHAKTQFIIGCVHACCAAADDNFSPLKGEKRTMASERAQMKLNRLIV